MSEGNGDFNLDKRGVSADELVKSLLEQIKNLENEILLVKNIKEIKENDINNKQFFELQNELNLLKGRYFELKNDIKNVVEAPEWNNFFKIVDRLKKLAEKIEHFIGLLQYRKSVSHGFLKRVDYLIMNEAIKNEMVSHIFEMLNRGESKEKLMSASLEFIYFLKEIDSDETLTELKELRDFIIVSEKEEGNIFHFLKKLNEKLGELTKEIVNPLQMVENLKELIEEIEVEVEEITSDLENKSKSLTSSGNEDK